MFQKPQIRQINQFSITLNLVAVNSPSPYFRPFGRHTHIKKLQNESWVPYPSPIWSTRGGTHIFGRTGMCCSNGSLFYKKSLNMGPVFYQKILKHSDWAQIFGLKPRKLRIFSKNWAYFSWKILKNGYPFLPKSPLKMGRVFEARAAHPCPTQIWVSPRMK